MADAACGRGRIGVYWCFVAFNAVVTFAVVYPAPNLAGTPLEGAQTPPADLLEASPHAVGPIHAGLAGDPCRAVSARSAVRLPGRRVRFQAHFGVWSAVLFVILIAGGTLPVLFDDPCQLPGRRPLTLVPHL